jgi:hypothetical protein
MSNTENHHADEDCLDLLYGAAAIAKYLRRPRQFVYHKQQHLGLRRIGSTLVVSKAELRKLLTQGDPETVLRAGPLRRSASPQGRLTERVCK